MRHLMMAPVALLCAVATAQMALVRGAGLTPWKGGGFGMFSSVVSPGSRVLRIYVETADGWLAAPVPRSELHAVWNLRALPSRPALEDLAARLRQYRWAQSTAAPSAELAPAPDSGEDDAGLPMASASQLVPAPPQAIRLPRNLRFVEVRSVRAELWQVEFDPGAHSVTSRRLLP